MSKEVSNIEETTKMEEVISAEPIKKELDYTQESSFDDATGALVDSQADKLFEIKSYVSGKQIDYLLSTAFYTGISYWADYDDIPEEYVERTKAKYFSEQVSDVLFMGGSFSIKDTEDSDSTVYELTLEKLLRGIELNAKNRPFDSNLDNVDSVTADCIIQFALFGEIIYG